MRPIDQADPVCAARETDRDVALLWTQARGRLLELARELELEGGQAAVTASQLRMVLRMAGEAVELRALFRRMQDALRDFDAGFGELIGVYRAPEERDSEED